MKTGRRHELQTNVLADYLGHQLQTVQPYLKWAAVALAAVCVIAIAGAVISQRSAAKSATAWDDFLSADSSTDRRKALEDVAAANEGTPAAIWALLVKGGMDLNTATATIYQSRAEAERSLKDAIESFQAVIDQGSRYPFLVQRAHYGMGVAYETMGELKKAQKEYELVVKEAESTAVGKEAKRVAQLKDEKVRKFYDWFIAQKDLPPLPQMNPNLPGDLRDLPDMPDMDLPDELFPGAPKTSDTTPGGAGTLGGTPGDIAPAGEITPGSDITPPVDITPANDINAPGDIVPPADTNPAPSDATTPPATPSAEGTPETPKPPEGAPATPGDANGASSTPTPSTNGESGESSPQP